MSWSDPVIGKTLVFGPQQDKLELRLAEECSQYYADPYGWVLWAFDWGRGDLEGWDGPDVWQRDILNEIGEQVRERGFDGVNPVDPIQMAVASGHGIGKSALTAWLILWIMSTRPFSKGIVTANTSDQLKTKTWAELGKWRSRCIVGHWFEYNSGKGSMMLYHKSYSESWRVDAQTCREENSEAFAGLHAASGTPFYIFDEASAVPDKIEEVAKGGLTDGEPMFFKFGNPTRNSGHFSRAFGSEKERWTTWQIDSRTAKMTNKRLIARWIEDYGEDSDFVRVRVRGMFPRASDMQYIATDDVSASMSASPGRYLGDDPLICGVDLARGGGDKCRIVFRRGRDAKSEKSYMIPGEKSRDSMRVVSLIASVLDRHKPDVTFVDETGLGGPIADRLSQLGYHVVGVNFGSNAEDTKHYGNKVAEMWSRMRAWIQAGGSLPKEPELERELTCREFFHDAKDRLFLEPKDVMKKDGRPSPDWADAIALTFAFKVPKRQMPRSFLDSPIGMRENTPSVSHDPMDDVSVDYDNQYRKAA